MKFCENVMNILELFQENDGETLKKFFKIKKF